MSADGPRVLETFLEAVRIDSPSGNEACFAGWCADRLCALGFEVRFDATGSLTGSDSGNLIAERAGETPGTTVVLSGHLDTVEPGRGIEPVVDEGVVRSAGATVLGADDKSALAAILEALTRLRERGVPTAAVRVLLSTSEELGLQGAKALDPGECRGDVCLVLDAHGDVGAIITAAPTQYTFQATFNGLPAHAGAEPEKGISAIAMAADAISRMTIGRVDELSTANVGEIAGGSATNVITAQCAIRGECRSRDRARVETIREQMDGAMREAARRAGGSVDVAWTLEYEGYRIERDDPLLKLVTDAMQAIGLVPQFAETGGGSDANIFAARGLPSVVLGCGMNDVHSTDEWIAVSELVGLADLVEAVLERAVRA